MVGVEIISFIPYLFIIPICIYGNIVVYQQKSAMFIKKRSVFMVFGLNISYCLVILTALNMHIGSVYNIGIFLSRNNPHVLAWWCVLFFLISKNWLIYWRYKWTAIIQLTWQKIINPKVVDSTNEKQNNFFIKYNHKFGNILFVAKVCGTFTVINMTNNIIYSILQSTKYHTISHIIAVFDLLAIIFMLVTYAVIVCKTPHYKDVYFIHWESKIQSKLLLFCGISIILFVSIIILFRIDYRVFTPIIVPFECVMFCIMTYLSTFKIINKNTENIHKKNIAMLALDIVSSCTPSHKDIDIELILSQAESVNAFMQHLSKEFSLECLLSLIEVSQFENYLINDEIHEIKEEIINKVNGANFIDFSESIPMSSIVESTDDLDAKAYKIYQKYIAVGSEFELNIPGDMKQKWIRKVAVQWGETKIDVNELMLLLEDVRREMRLLLTFSLMRFMKTIEFGSVIEMNQDL
eukprot:178188_1